MHSLQVEADAKADISVLVEYSLLQELQEASGVYRLHDLTHEFLQLVSRVEAGHLPRATSRLANFLAKPETLLAYTKDLDGIYGGVYSLVKLWVTLKGVDGSTWEKMAHQIVKVLETETNVANVTGAGDLLMRMVSYDIATPIPA